MVFIKDAEFLSLIDLILKLGFFFKGLPLDPEGVTLHSIPFLNSQILVLRIGSKYK